MAYYMTPFGDVIRYPEIDDQAFLSVSPLTFVNRLMAANPNMPVRVLECENIKYTFMGMMTFKHLELSPLADIRAQRVGLLQRWESSAEWRILRFLLDADTSEVHFQTVTPLKQPRVGPRTFLHGTFEIILPPLSDHLFTVDGLDIERFIEALKSSNQKQQELLDVEVIRAAVKQCALQGFPGAAPGLFERFLAELSEPRSVRALNDHSRWLNYTRQCKALSSQGMQAPGPSHKEPLNGFFGQSVIPSGNKAVQEVAKRRTSSSGSPSEGKRYGTDGMQYAMNHIPEIHYMDSNRRSRLITRDCSLHVSLSQDDKKFVSSKPVKTHLHYLADSPGFVKLEIVVFYDRAIVVEFDSRELRDAGAHQIAATKFSFGSSVLRPAVTVFTDSEGTRQTRWSFSRSASDHSYSVHEALRRFFCLQGHVPIKDFTGEKSRFNGRGTIEVDYNKSPVWLQKLAATGRKDTFYQVRNARSCEFCDIATSDASSQMAGTVKENRRPLSEQSRSSNVRSVSQLARPITTHFESLSVENQRPSLTLEVRKRSAEQMKSPEKPQTSPKKQRMSDNATGASSGAGVGSSGVAGEFLEALGKELEGSSGLQKTPVKSKPTARA